MDDFVLGVRTSDIVVFEFSNLEHILLLQFYFHTCQDPTQEKGPKPVSPPHGDSSYRSPFPNGRDMDDKSVSTRRIIISEVLKSVSISFYHIMSRYAR